MDKTALIARKPDSVAKFGANFLELKKRGLEHIQELSGNLWTDYNHHDPGITILEQICYALTEISYQENLKIPDLLTHHNDKEPDYERLALTLPDNAFSNHALKPVDYSRMLYDRVDGVVNSWLLPVNEEGVPGGLYHLYLNILDKEAYQTPSAHSRIRQEALEIMNGNRNLGEDLRDITILKYKSVDVRAKIIVETARDPSEVLAEIILKIEECLTPRMQFSIFDELLQQGYSMDEIFEGPRLINGIILHSSYKEKPGIVDSNSVTDFITRVPDVDSVRTLCLVDGSETMSRIEINRDEVLRYHFDINAVSDSIEMIQKGSLRKMIIDKELFERHYRSLRTALRRKLPVSKENLKPQVNQLTISKGRDYYSIQNDFPAIYGINRYGVPSHESDLRKAQAQQLKGFLYFFEQILADGMELPHSLKSLFSVSETEESYPFTLLTDSNIPGITNLYSGFDGDHHSFNEQFQSLQNRHDNYIDRKSNALNYLISLYGESCSLYSVSQFNYYYTDKEFKTILLQLKVRFLKLIADLNYNRSGAFDYSRLSSNASERWDKHSSGLEMKARILLGITKNDDNTREVSCRSGFEFYRLDLKSTSAIDDADCYSDSSSGHGRIEINYNDRSAELHFRAVDFLQGMKLSDDECSECLKDTRMMKDGTVDDELLKSGITLKNYRVGKVSSDGVFQVLLRSMYKEKMVWRKLGNVESAKKACDLVLSYLQRFRELSIKSEDFILLEHILLRPSSKTETQEEDLLIEWDTKNIKERYKKGQKVRERTSPKPDTRPKFFSHKISIFMPSWTARFTSPGYRSLVAETFNLLIPAHLVCDLYWLSPEEMCDFENRYNRWLSQKSNLRGDRIILDDLSHDLIGFIQKLRLNEDKDAG